MRLYRQAMFDWVGPPDTVVVLDEAVLHRLIGLAHVIHDVFVHIAEMSRRPSLDVAIQQALMACWDEGAVPRVGDG